MSTRTHALAACALLVLTGCAGRSSPPKESVAGVAFYQPPSPLVAGRPGEVIHTEEVTGLPLHPPSRVWRLLYHSVGAAGGDVAMSAFAIVPKSAAPTGGRPVFAWAHGTAGLGDQCAPSRHIRENLPPYGGQQADRGAVLVAPDYEGLGTPGVPPYAVGRSDAHATLDAIRAAATLPGVGPLGGVVLAGHSEGGRAALLSGQIAGAYAPELHLRGILALAPGADLPAVARHLLSSPFKGGDVMGAIGLTTADPTIRLSDVLTDAALKQVHAVENECTDAIMKRFADLPWQQVFRQDPLTVPVVARGLAAASVTSLPRGLPVLIAAADHDQQITAAALDPLIHRLCRAGVLLQVDHFGGDHDGLDDIATNDVLPWLEQRFAGTPTTARCA